MWKYGKQLLVNKSEAIYQFQTTFKAQIIEKRQKV